MNPFTPTPPPSRADRRPFGRAIRGLAVAATALALLEPAGAAYTLAPQYAGSFAAGTGADAELYRIDNAWHASAVLWNGQTYGSGSPVSGFTWGSGLWGQVDWQAVQDAASGQASAASGFIVQSFEGVLGAINLGNSRYNECYASTPLGAAALDPFFAPSAALGDCNNAEAGDPAHQNWTARYTGFIRITEPGEYNFGVLNDDGFFFRLFGAGGAERGIGRDYLNPPLRVGFTDTLSLGAGLYGFELGAWNRLGAGVVDLRWARGCVQQCDWAAVPTENLLNAAQVPEPPAVLLVLAGLLGLLGLGTSRARLRRLRWPHAWCSRPRA